MQDRDGWSHPLSVVLLENTDFLYFYFIGLGIDKSLAINLERHPTCILNGFTDEYKMLVYEGKVILVNWIDSGLRPLLDHRMNVSSPWLCVRTE